MKKNGGQALIELAAFVLFTTSLITAFLGFTKAFSIRQELLLAAREGILLYSSGHFTEDEVRHRLTDYLASGTPALLRDRIQIRIGRAADQPNAPVPALQARLVGLDYVTVNYMSASNWLLNLGLNPIIEETFYMKHANSYGPSLPALWGPPVRP